MSNIYSIDSARPNIPHASQYALPGEVLAHPGLSTDEKRAILSAWASDMYAVASRPDLRRIPGHRSAIRLGDILSALRKLDGDDDPPPKGGLSMPRALRSMDADAPADADVLPARRKAHRDNIRRYIRLLGTELTELERRFIRRRLEEERQSLAALDDATPAICIAAGCNASA